MDFTITKVFEARTGREITNFSSLFSITSTGMFELLDLSGLITKYQIYIHITNTDLIVDSYLSQTHLVDATIHYECAHDNFTFKGL